MTSMKRSLWPRRLIPARGVVTLTLASRNDGALFRVPLGIRKPLAFRRMGHYPAGMKDYKAGSHTLWDCKYHLVWVTKYRYPVLPGDVGERVRELLREISRAHEMTIYAGSVNRDHVHMLTRARPRSPQRQSRQRPHRQIADPLRVERIGK
jgi:Transposase IS200 like